MLPKPRGGVVLNDDNDDSRRAVEFCYRTHKTMVNPIVDWDDNDVWEFLNSNNIPHCCLYDEGFKRLGCIGCPLSGSKNMERDFERWPKYKAMYIRAFQHMIDNHPGQIRILDPNAGTKFKLELEENSIEGGGYNGFGIGSNGADAESPNAVSTLPEFDRWGYSESVLPDSGRGDAVVHPRMGRDESLNGSSPTVIPDNSIRGGYTTRQLAEAMLERWKKVALC